MPISFTNYVEIVSGVGAGSSVRQRDLIGRFFDTNALIPTSSIVEFDSLGEVGDYFGTSGAEYARALFYFGWISKNITTPQKISFARWANADTASQIFGRPATYALATFTAVTTGAINLTVGGFTHTVTSIDLHLAASLAGVASAIQTALRAYSAGGAAWTGCTVAYDATRGCFNFTSGSTGDDVISIGVAGSGVDLSPLLGWTTGAIFSNGLDEQSITDLLTDSTQANNNFGSFAFMSTLSQDQIVEAAEWNDAQNVAFIYSVPCTASNASALSAALLALSGVSLTLSPLAGEYPEQVPMMILAATDYTKRNSTQNYMFQIFSLTPSVTNDLDYLLYNGLRVNFYGNTQTAGQILSFYQRGVMCGLASDPVDQNTYANEEWLKDAAAAAFMTLLLALAKVSANIQGRTQMLATLQSVVTLALFNGTISVGKTLTSAQKLFITNATGDDRAWYQVQNTGYWMDVVMQSFTTEDGRVEWKAVYTLIYSKDDVIRKVEGQHILI